MSLIKEQIEKINETIDTNYICLCSKCHNFITYQKYSTPICPTCGNIESYPFIVTDFIDYPLSLRYKIRSNNYGNK